MNNTYNSVIINSYNNTSISTQGSISMTGSTGYQGNIGKTGLQSTAGPGGYMTDWKDEIMKKYPRFTIRTEYDVMTFAPINIIIDNNTGVEYKLKPISSNMINVTKETEQFIQQLIVTIREDKINNIINE